MMDSFVKLWENVNRLRETKLDRNQIRMSPRTRLDLKCKQLLKPSSKSHVPLYSQLLDLGAWQFHIPQANLIVMILMG